MDEKFKYIDNINFNKLLERLTDEKKCQFIDPLMDMELAEALFFKYRCFLKLFVLYPTKTLVPTIGIDIIWHYHILDTKQYMEDCTYLFNKYMHHVPNYSLYTDKAKVLQEDTMKKLFLEHFNTDYFTVYKDDIF